MKTPVEGDNLSLSCNVTGGFPDPTITWTKDDVDVPVKRNSSLTFTNIKRDKAGDYICSANNSCGEFPSQVTRIEVQCKRNPFFLNVF